MRKIPPERIAWVEEKPQHIVDRTVSPSGSIAMGLYLEEAFKLTVVGGWPMRKADSWPSTGQVIVAFVLQCHRPPRLTARFISLSIIRG